MSDRIAVMPSALADLIAAGEVVERPASALKELVENSLDAEATHIFVDITYGGLKSIQVKDDGVGMSAHDARLCILRHASSKVKTSFDLMDIKTMGFRGEALPSIIAVSSFTMTTSDGNEGTTIKASGDKPVEFTDAPLRKGTTALVEDLFYNTPARLKYMKSPQTERAKCLDVMEHLALGFPHVSFDVRADGKQVFSTSGRGDVVEAIQRIYGNDIARSIMRVEKKAAYGFSFEAFIAKPEINYSTKYQIMSFINRRYIYSPKISKAVEEAYRDYLAPLRYPFALVMIDADPALIDVNVHPSKKEVRISGEESLAVEIREAILNELKGVKPVYGSRDSSNLLDRNNMAQPENERDAFSPAVAPAQPSVSEDTPRILPKKDFDYGSEILQGLNNVSFQGNTSNEVKQAAEHFEKKQEPVEEKAPSIYDNLSPLGQIAKTYIICDSPEGMYIVDQHAAAERINFEKFQALFEEKVEIVSPLEPVIVDLQPSVVSGFDDSKAQILEKFGLKVEPFGPSSLKLMTMPEFIASKDYYQVIKDLIVAAAEGKEENPLELMRKAVATMACKASVRAGDELSPFAQVALLKHLGECRNPANCPHGRPTAIKVTIHELEKLFKRTGF